MDKTLGPNGFALGFWQDCGELVKEEIISFKAFLEMGHFVKSLNSTFVVLISKKKKKR